MLYCCDAKSQQMRLDGRNYKRYFSTCNKMNDDNQTYCISPLGSYTTSGIVPPGNLPRGCLEGS